MKPDIFKKAKFRILKAKSTLKCRVCGTKWQFNFKKSTKQLRKPSILFPRQHIPTLSVRNVAVQTLKSPVDAESGWQDMKGVK